MADAFVHATYIRTTAATVWATLLDPAKTAAFWGHANVSDSWAPGSTWEHVRTDGSGIADAIGTVAVSEPPTRLVLTMGDPGGPPSRVEFLIEEGEGIVRLTVTHTELDGPEGLAAVARGWPAVCSNLKSLLETGETLPQAPWLMP